MKLLDRIRGEGLGARAIRSSGFVLLKFGGSKALRLASNLVLTRLLFPEAFGIMALVQVVLSGAEMFSDLGIRASIVQDKRGDDPDFLNTAWTIQVFRGFVLGAAVFLLAEPMAAFYEEPLLADLLRFSAIQPILAGFASTRLATAGRHLALGRQTILELVTQVAGIFATIALAWWLQSVWALVIGGVVPRLLMTILSHIVLPGQKNRFGFERDAIHRLVHFGKWIFLATIAGFFINQGDKIVLGKLVDLTTLALYNIAYLLAALPLAVGGAMASRVIFPLYARKPPWESDENRRKIHRARFLLTAALLPMLMVMSLIGDRLIRFLYDQRYHDAGPYMVLIALALMPRVITIGYGNLVLAAGHSQRYAVYHIFAAFVAFSTMSIGAYLFGVLGAILAPVAAFTLTYPALIWTIWPYKGWDPRHDAIYIALALIAAALAIWHNFETVSDLFVSF